MIASVRQFSKTIIVINSTFPIGYTNRISESLQDDNFDSSPEFLREGHALHDCLYPSRIIVGHSLLLSNYESARKNIELLDEGTLSSKSSALFMGATEAEAIKFFANTYLAMRVSFFNEMYSYAELKGLYTR